MTVYSIDPIRDPRWADFVERHESASVFHSVPWLQALQQTYGYKPVAYTTSQPSSPLSNGVVLCQIRSWMTGRRMVSVPFSDHCEPLLDGPDAATAIAEELKNLVDRGEWKYIELRPRGVLSALAGAVEAPACHLHMLDIKPAESELLRQAHKNAIQAPIKRAEREGLEYQCGNSEALLNAFFHLMIQTRRRHQLPPQPIEWFRNLAACMGDRLQIRVARNHGEAIASILTIGHKDVIVYKYACSNNKFHNLGATPFLLWKAIGEARATGKTCMDFGRSDADNPGLITFKDRWGAKSSPLIYLRWTQKQSRSAGRQRSSGVIKHLLSIMPDSVLETTGRILYRHVG